MLTLEFRFEVILVFLIAASFALLNVNGDIPPNVDSPGNSDESSIDDNHRDNLPNALDHTLGINYVDDDDDDEDDDAIGDEGFYNEDDDDEGDPDSLGPSFKGSGSSVIHKKDDIHQIREQSTEHAQQQEPKKSGELGSPDDDEGSSSSGSGSGDTEIKGQEVFARQHASENEEKDDVDASADKDEIDNTEDENEREEKTNYDKDEHTAVKSQTKALKKQPKNLIKMVPKQEEEGSSKEHDIDEESSGQHSGSSSNFTPGRGKTRVDLSSPYVLHGGITEELPSLKTENKSLIGVKTNTSIPVEVVTKGNGSLATKPSDQKDKGSGVQHKNVSTSKNKEENKKDDLKSATSNNSSLHEVYNNKAKIKGNTKQNAEHIHHVQNTQPPKKIMKQETIKTVKPSPHLATKKLHNKYLMAARVTHTHVVKGQTKAIHKKPITKAVPPTCHPDSILAGHSLKGGTRAGRFESLGETASMHACLQRCCTKQTCDVALLIDGRCYGVACFSMELCEAVPVPHPHFIFSQLGFVNKGQKRGDIERTQGFHCQYGNLTLRNNEQWSGELCGGVVRCKDGIATVTKCPGIPPKPADCAKPRLIVKHQKGKCCQMEWRCKARHCSFNNRLIKHGYKLSDPLCTGVVSCYNGHLSMEYCPKIPDKPKDCAWPKLKTINTPGKCCKKLWVCSDKSCKYDGLKLSHGEKLTDASCAVVMECKNGFLHNKQCPVPPPVPHSCINPTLKVKRIPGECCEMKWACEMS